GFEEHEAVFLKDRHLPEGLQRAIVRFVLIAQFEEARLVRQTSFLSAQRARRSRTWPWANSGTHLKAEIVIMRCTPLRFSWRRLKLVEGFAPADHLAVATLGSAADVWSRSSITRKWRSSLSSAPVQPSSWLRRGRNSRRCR